MGSSDEAFRYGRLHSTLSRHCTHKGRFQYQETRKQIDSGMKLSCRKPPTFSSFLSFLFCQISAHAPLRNPFSGLWLRYNISVEISVSKIKTDMESPRARSLLSRSWKSTHIALGVVMKCIDQTSLYFWTNELGNNVHGVNVKWFGFNRYPLDQHHLV